MLCEASIWGLETLNSLECKPAFITIFPFQKITSPVHAFYLDGARYRARALVRELSYVHAARKRNFSEYGISIAQKMGSEVINFTSIRAACSVQVWPNNGSLLPFSSCSVEAWAGLHLFFYLPALHLLIVWSFDSKLYNPNVYLLTQWLNNRVTVLGENFTSYRKF